MRVVHYMGGKPWQTAQERKASDWEDNTKYEPLFAAWWAIWHGRGKELAKTGDGVIVDIPIAPVKENSKSKKPSRKPKTRKISKIMLQKGAVTTRQGARNNQRLLLVAVVALSIGIKRWSGIF